MKKEIAELFKNALPLMDAKILQQQICRLFHAEMMKLIEEARVEKNLCNYCGKHKKRDVFCSDECAENAERDHADYEYERHSLHG